MSYAAIISWCETLVWVLGHSLWQGAMAAGVVWLALRSIPARRANVRYGVAVLGLAAVVLSLLVTWSVLRLDRTPVSPSSSGLVAEREPLPQPAPVGNADRTVGPDSHRFHDDARPATGETGPLGAWAVWVAVVWGIGAGVMITRGLAGLVQAHALTGANTSDSSLDIGVLEGIARECAERLGLTRRVRLLVVERIRVPAAVGIFWPTVLVPVAMLSGTPVEHWRVILG
jgi:hypothetical protein